MLLFYFWEYKETQEFTNFTSAWYASCSGLQTQSPGGLVKAWADGVPHPEFLIQYIEGRIQEFAVLTWEADAAHPGTTLQFQNFWVLF